ncbi:VPLPA-CTERM sorting domain-containing protein [Roseobacter sp. A03A-229]
MPFQLAASTVTDLPDIETEPLGAFSLAELLREDPLGGDCIAEEDIDLAFFAAGKGMRLPRTCLPEPCNEALTPFRLAELIGRPAQPSEWEQYFSRYADACRKEVVSFDEETAAPEPASKAEFWGPILGGRVVQGQLILPQQNALRLFGRGTGARPATFASFGAPFGGGSGGGGGGGGDTPIQTLLTDPEDGDPTRTGGEPEDNWPKETGVAPSPVPLPVGAWLLLSGIVSLVALRRLSICGQA